MESTTCSNSPVPAGNELCDGTHGSEHELRRKIGDRFGEAESLFTQAPLARAEGRDADVVGLLGDARRRRVEIGDRPASAECNAELARLPQRPVPA